jgi:hypothetical protein
MKVFLLLLGIGLSTAVTEVAVKDVQKAMQDRRIFGRMMDSREVRKLTGKGRMLKLDDQNFSTFSTKFGILGFGECPLDAKNHPWVCDGILIGLNPDSEEKFPAARFEVLPRLVGVSLGTTEAEVRKNFGKPLREEKMPYLGRNCIRLWFNLEDAGSFLCAYVWRGRVIALTLTEEITSW